MTTQLPSRIAKETQIKRSGNLLLCSTWTRSNEKKKKLSKLKDWQAVLSKLPKNIHTPLKQIQVVSLHPTLQSLEVSYDTCREIKLSHRKNIHTLPYPNQHKYVPFPFDHMPLSIINPKISFYSYSPHTKAETLLLWSIRCLKIYFTRSFKAAVL